MIFDAGLFAPVMRETFGRIRANARTLGLVYAAATFAAAGYDLSIELLGESAIIYYFAFAFFMLFLQACVVIAILDPAGALSEPRRWRIASLFGLGLVTSLGIFVGFLLLVLPALFLLGRWFLAAPILFGEDVSVSEAMSESWERTERYWLSAALIALLCFVWQLAPLFAGSYILLDDAALRWASTIALNAVSQAGWLFALVASATMYLAIADPKLRHQEIFS
jgi:hypothetical protein